MFSHRWGSGGRDPLRAGSLPQQRTIPSSMCTSPSLHPVPLPLQTSSVRQSGYNSSQRQSSRMLDIISAMSFPSSDILENPPSNTATARNRSRPRNSVSSSGLHPKLARDIPSAAPGAGRGHKEKWSIERRRHVGKPGF